MNFEVIWNPTPINLLNPGAADRRSTGVSFDLDPHSTCAVVSVSFCVAPVMENNIVELQESPKLSTQDGTKMRRKSTGRPNSSKVGVGQNPNYLRASTGSCHDLCKYGRKHEFEAGAKEPIVRRASSSTNASGGPVESVTVAERKKKTMAKPKASSDAKFTSPAKPPINRREVLSLSKRIGTSSEPATPMKPWKTNSNSKDAVSPMPKPVLVAAPVNATESLKSRRYGAVIMSKETGAFQPVKKDFTPLTVAVPHNSSLIGFTGMKNHRSPKVDSHLKNQKNIRTIEVKQLNKDQSEQKTSLSAAKSAKPFPNVPANSRTNRSLKVGPPLKNQKVMGETESKEFDKCKDEETSPVLKNLDVVFPLMSQSCNVEPGSYISNNDENLLHFIEMDADDKTFSTAQDGCPALLSSPLNASSIPNTHPKVVEEVESDLLDINKDPGTSHVVRNGNMEPMNSMYENRTETEDATFLIAQNASPSQLSFPSLQPMSSSIPNPNQKVMGETESKQFDQGNDRDTSHMVKNLEIMSHLKSKNSSEKPGNSIHDANFLHVSKKETEDEAFKTDQSGGFLAQLYARLSSPSSIPISSSILNSTLKVTGETDSKQIDNDKDVETPLVVPNPEVVLPSMHQYSNANIVELMNSNSEENLLLLNEDKLYTTTQDGSPHALSPSPSLSPKSSSILNSPVLSSNEEEYLLDFEYTISGSDCSSEDEAIKLSTVETSESGYRGMHGNGRLLLYEGKDSEPTKLKFRRGKVVDLQSKNNGPRRLRFKPARMLGEGGDQNEVCEARWIRFKKREIVDGHTIGDLGSEKIVLRHQDAKGKKDALGLFNYVIEETASKLVETRKSKVKALVGAFETVMSLQDKPSPTGTAL